MAHWGGGGVLGNLSQIIFGLNGVKSCNFRQYEHGNGTFMKARDSVYDGRRDNPLNLELILFFYIYTLFNTGERSEPEKKKIKTTFDPLSYPSNIHTRPHLW